VVWDCGVGFGGTGRSGSAAACIWWPPVVLPHESVLKCDSIVFDGCGEATLGEVMMLDAEVR